MVGTRSGIDFSSYAFNGCNLLPTNYPNLAYNGILPGIGGQKLSAVKNSAKTVLVEEASGLLPYSWHQPKPPMSVVGRCLTMPKTWSVLWTATPATSRFIGTARLAILMGASQSPLITIHRRITIINGVEIKNAHARLFRTERRSRAVSENHSAAIPFLKSAKGFHPDCNCSWSLLP